MTKYILLIIALIILIPSLLSAQTHNSIPVTQENLYRILEAAEIRGLIDRLPGMRPYPRSLVVKALEGIKKKSHRLTKTEKIILEDFLARYSLSEDKPFLRDGDWRLEDKNFPFLLGMRGQLGFNIDAANPSAWSSENMAGIYVQGDLGSFLSYGLNLGGGLFKVDAVVPESWEPFTYTKKWDGGIHPLSSLSSFVQMPVSWSGGYTFIPEITASFWDNKLFLRFSRQRRDGGIGESSLILDASARPFLGFDLTLQPWPWLTFSSVMGPLEYGETFPNSEDYSIKATSKRQQNMYSLFQLELAPAKWLYLAVYDGAVYPKRFELGYMLPFMSQFLNQNNIGDFDNLMLGGTLALSWPGLFRTYFNLYLDEARFSSPDFFRSFHNMYSFQAGIQFPVPGLPWTTLTFQYSKVEPFTYTHYLVSGSPWYDGVSMETGYLNNGENLALSLPPNSDEFLLLVTTQPALGWSALGKFRLLRHGFGSNAQDGGSNGGSLDSWGDPTPDSDPDGAYGRGPIKNFLKDGEYRWYFIVSLGGELDLRLFNFPAKVGLSNSFVYSWVTDYASQGNWQADPAYGDTIKNIVSLTFQFFPW